MANIRTKIKFARRKSTGTGNGLVTFFLSGAPDYTPSLNQRVIITHTNVAENSGLKTKLDSISTNTVTGQFQSYQQNLDSNSIIQSDGFSQFFVIRYDDVTFSSNQFGGSCDGYIEFDANVSSAEYLKAIENAVIVSENVPFDNADAQNTISSHITQLSGLTVSPMFFMKRNAVKSIFANTLKSLNLPVTDDAMKQYTRSAYGTLTQTSGTTYDTLIDGIKYNWSALTTTGSTAIVSVHPTTGHTGDFYSSALQTIGSYNFLKDNYFEPVKNGLYLAFEIPQNSYGEIIDGKTFKLSLPYWAPTGNTTGHTEENQYGVYSGYTSSPSTIELFGTYNLNGLSKFDLDRVLSEKGVEAQTVGNKLDLSKNPNEYESNIVFLFCNDIKTPQVDDFDSWEDGHENAFEGIKVLQNNSTRSKALFDFRRDECVGFVALDKGFVVITHPLIVDSFFIKGFGGVIDIQGSGSNREKTYLYYDSIPQGTSLTRLNVTTASGDTRVKYTIEEENGFIDWDSTQFLYNATGTTIPTMRFLSYNSEKNLVITCTASSGEFVRSTNDTAKVLHNTTSPFPTFKTDNTELYPVCITKIGIHDADGNLLAICVPSQPIKKYWYDVVSFNLKIRV